MRAVDSRQDLTFRHATCQDAGRLLDRWQRQTRHLRRSHHPRRRRLAALGYLIHGPLRQDLIPIDRFTLVVLSTSPDDSLTLAGFSAERVEWGVIWGGSARNRFAKDLALRPTVGGRGARLNLAQFRLVHLALQLQSELSRHALHPQLPITGHFKMPRLWAGFRASHARQILGDGPELAAACREARRPPETLLAQSRRTHPGLILFPLDWVSHAWQQMIELFVEVKGFPKRQAFQLRDGEESLAGYQGASEFNLQETRFKHCQVA
jgi:hypothetical protein